MKRQEREDFARTAVLWLILTLACLFSLSSIMWYVKAQETADLKLVNAAYSERIKKLNEEIADKRYKIQQANSLLSVAYPNSRMDFLSED